MIYSFYVWVHFHCLQTHQKRASDPITDGHEPPCGCWELNSEPLEEQSMLLITDPFLRDKHTETSFKVFASKTPCFSVSVSGLCVCMCIYVCMCACVYACVYVYICVYALYLYVCRYVSLCVHVCMFACVFMCVHACVLHVCMYVCFCVCLSTCLCPFPLSSRR